MHVFFLNPMWLKSCAKNMTRLLHPEQEQVIEVTGGKKATEIDCLVVWGGLG